MTLACVWIDRLLSQAVLSSSEHRAIRNQACFCRHTLHADWVDAQEEQMLTSATVRCSFLLRMCSIRSFLAGPESPDTPAFCV